MRDTPAAAATLSDSDLYALPCACANLRRLARVMTRLYDAALKPAGLEVTQFSLLAMLAMRGEAVHGVLNRGFAMDSTTLTRTLAVMTSRGWIRATPGADRRTRVYRIAAEGRRRFEKARPQWAQVQRVVEAHVGATGWTTLGHDVPTMTASLDAVAPPPASARRQPPAGVSPGGRRPAGRKVPS